MSGEVPENPEDEQWERHLEHARDLVRELEAGNRDEAIKLINELSNARESDLYQEVGRLTRDLHEQINSFVDESRLRSIMQDEIPDARDRLSYVIRLTEESAHKTLTLVEHSMPVVDALGLRAREVQSQWQEFMRDKKGVDALRMLIVEMDNYLQQVVDETGAIHNDLFDVLLAQSYQDITGQVLQRVITLVQNVEQSLLDIVETTGQNRPDQAENMLTGKDASASLDQQKKKDEVDMNNSGHGPAVPGIAGKDVMNGQDDVDDLLSTLGF